MKSDARKSKAELLDELVALRGEFGELRKSEEKYRLISECTDDLIATCTFSLNPVYTYVSASHKRNMGLEPGDLLGKPGFDYLHPEDRKKFLPLLRKYIQMRAAKLLAGKEELISESLELRFRGSEGNWHTVESTVNIIGDELLFVSKDVSAGKRTERELRDSEERYRALVENLPVGIYYNDFKGRFVYGNASAERIVGYRREELIGKSFLDLNLLDARSLRKAVHLLGRNILGKPTGPDELELRKRDGTVIDAEVSTQIITIGGRRVVMGMVDDVTERRRAEERIQDLSSAVEGSIDGMAMCDLNQRLTYVNRSFARMYGHSPSTMTGMTINASLNVTDAQWQEVLQCVKRDGSWVGEQEQVGENGRRFPAHASVAAIHNTGDNPSKFLVIVRDMSEYKRIEEQLQIRQRLDSLGTLAGGLAHDLNNILGGLLGSLELLELESSTLTPICREYVADAMTCCRRAADLVQQFHVLSSGNISVKTAIDLWTIGSEVFRFLESTTDRLIDKRLDIERGRYWVQGNASELIQVFLNLATNAVQAIQNRGARPGDFLCISAEDHLSTKHSRLSLPVGEYVHVMLADNGQGMSSSVRSRAFDPFFSTKPKATRSGQGLGLSMAYNIVTRSHEGYIEIESAEGRGSVIHLYLPKAKPNQQCDPVQGRRMDSGKGRILVVDDEETILKTVRAILSKQAHEVVTAGSGACALEIFREQKDQVDAAIVDLVMPEISGKMLIRELLSIKSTLKIIVCSGHREEDAGSDSVVGAHAYLKKPFTMEELLRAVAEVLQDG